MTVTDPIFGSLWDSTLAELGSENGIWEIYWDTPNFHAGASAERRAEEAETVLRRLHAEGWANFVRKPWNAAPDQEGEILADDEVEALIAGRSWQTEPPLPDGLPDHLNVWLVPTQKWAEWDASS